MFLGSGCLAIFIHHFPVHYYPCMGRYHFRFPVDIALINKSFVQFANFGQIYHILQSCRLSGINKWLSNLKLEIIAPKNSLHMETAADGGGSKHVCLGTSHLVEFYWSCNSSLWWHFFLDQPCRQLYCCFERPLGVHCSEECIIYHSLANTIILGCSYMMELYIEML